MPKNWVNLHNHTTFSMLDGYGTCEKYAQQAKQFSMGAISITDHGNIYGWLDFYDACKKYGIKPILGLEAYQARKTRFDRDEEERSGRVSEEMGFDQRGPYHLTILARNYTGYQNLIKLSSLAYLDGYYVKPRIDHELIAQYHDGLIILSGCLNGEVQQALLRDDYNAALQAAGTMQDIVGRENYFIELQDHGIDEQRRVYEDVLRIANTINARIVPTGDCHYVHKDDAYHHDVMLCAGTASKLSDEDRFKFAGPEFYLKPYDEMAKVFDQEWLENTCHIADMVNVELEFNEMHFPKFPDTPADESVDAFLEKQVWAGAHDRYGVDLTEEVVERIKYELGVVKRMGFQEYFLVVGDIVRWAKGQGIRVGWGRGSAAGSILSYCLKITNLDPIKFGLLFERFLVEGRKSMPDIDLDIDSRYRDKVIDYARQKYGEERVCHIITFQSVKAKTAVRDAARVLGYEYSLGDKISKLMPPAVLGETKTIQESLEISEDLRNFCNKNEQASDIINAALGLEGLYRQQGTHAAGVIISPGPMIDYIPVALGGDKKDIIVSSWDMYRVDEVGMLKIDFLSLLNLAIIDITLDNICKCYDLEIDIDNINLNDPGVYEDFKKGNTIGVFQLESSGMRSTMLNLQPDNLNDIMALISLYRPGPMGSGMDKMYINRKHGREPVTYEHEVLRDVLSSTYGIMLYQEDVLNVARELAGFDAGEADDLRKVIGKKLMKEVGEYREKFIEGCRSTHNVHPKVSNKIYSDIEYFAGYGFNRAHAASYAMVAYANAWLKHHFPAAYMAALLTSVASKKERLARYLNECRRLGIGVLPPSINHSDFDFKVNPDENVILFGLSAIDGMGEAKLRPILEDRKEHGSYTNIHDFFRKSQHALNKATLGHLYRAGALDELVDDDIDITITRKERVDLLNLEKSEIGIYVTDHPLKEIWQHINKDVRTNIIDLHDMGHSSEVTIGGMITSLTRLTTKSNRLMYKFVLQDLTGDIPIIAFPREAAKITEGHLEEGAVGILTGTLQHEGDETGDNYVSQVVYSRFVKLDQEEILGDPPILLESASKLTTTQIIRIRDIIKSIPGESAVYMSYPEGNHRITVRFADTTSKEIEEDLQKVVQFAALQAME